jgi:hypothetical protein
MTTNTVSFSVEFPPFLVSAHFESPPFANGQHISAYHVRAIEMFRLGLLADSKRKLLNSEI